MKIGHKYQIAKLPEHPCGVKLICLGVKPGKIITIVRRAPINGGYLIACDQKRFAMSLQEIQMLSLVEIQAVS